MDVTPTPVMFAALERIVDMAVGEAPLKIEKTPAADRRREHRHEMFTILHNLVALSMREGVRRYLQEHGAPVMEATAIETAVGDDKPIH